LKMAEFMNTYNNTNRENKDKKSCHVVK